ncbi:hypothetical protein [Actinomycetospora soli]|uniref:hypothetical protein n=1 Tax=Actinomycetospora soli TaxID=2893887 RepID=UPI001E2AAC6D|nr:hypothetical protein [Actinomycetospora soli]MCD2191712.1 hypothetical protein [Actinomycetospora soli]
MPKNPTPNPTTRPTTRPTPLRLLPQPDPTLAGVFAETLDMELPELDARDRARVVATVLGLLVTTQKEHQPTRYAMSVLLATPCRRCARAIGWDPFEQGWLHYTGARCCTPDAVLAHDSELARRMFAADRAADRAQTEHDTALAADDPVAAAQATARGALATALAGQLAGHLHATP